MSKRDVIVVNVLAGTVLGLVWSGCIFLMGYWGIGL